MDFVSREFWAFSTFIAKWFRFGTLGICEFVGVLALFPDIPYPPHQANFPKHRYL
jgi:hypothetical protein